MNKGDLQFVRGDTFFIRRRLVDEDENVLIPNPNTDGLNFTMREDVESDEALIEKNISDISFEEDGSYVITIAPSDTEGLDFGTYGYDIELITGVNETVPFVRTVESGKIKLLPYDYTRREEEENG